MDSNPDVELLSKAIEKLLGEKRKRDADGETFVEDDDDQLLLSKVLSQLKGKIAPKQPDWSTEEDAQPKGLTEKDAQPEGLTDELSQPEGLTKEAATPKVLTKEDTIVSFITIDKTNTKSESTMPLDNQTKDISTAEIVKEIKKVKRQNTVTHVLLSGLILLTAAWQLGEVSVILRVKDRLSHPFRSFGNAFIGMFKGPAPLNDQLPGKNQRFSKEDRNNHVESHSFPSFHVPELLRDLGFNDEE